MRMSVMVTAMPIIVYADRAREVNGDYARLAFLDYRTLTLKLEKVPQQKPLRPF